MVKTLKKHQRGAIFRLGKFNRIAGPGFIITMPLFEYCQTIALREIIPEWEILTNEQIEERLKKHFLSPGNNRFFFKR